MAIEAMVAVFKQSRAHGVARLVLLALANQASDRGEVVAYARSQTYIAALANCTDKGAKKAIEWLVEAGELSVLNAGSGRTQSTYEIHLPTLCEARRCKHESSGGVFCSPPLGGAPFPPGGNTGNPQGVRSVPPHHSVVSVDSPSSPPEQSVGDGTTGPDDAPRKASPPPTPAPERGYTQPVPGGALVRKKPGKATTGQRALDAGKPVDAGRQFGLRNPDSIARCLAPHGITIRNQADRRNLDKLADKRPTIDQLDGVCNLLAVEGHVDLGRLVVKWDSLKDEHASRPTGWYSPRQENIDRTEAHIAAGGGQYDQPGHHDYLNR